MTTVREFHNIMAQLKGIKHFILTRNDGRVVTHDLKNPAELSTMISYCGLNADAMRKFIGTTRFRYMVFIHGNRQRFFIVPLGNYFLGVLMVSNASTSALAVGISQLFKIHKDVR
jgi:predicted regulator of Ras-like GTPase activity (Roadblock/LC7/MglB family)